MQNTIRREHKYKWTLHLAGYCLSKMKGFVSSFFCLTHCSNSVCVIFSACQLKRGVRGSDFTKNFIAYFGVALGWLIDPVPYPGAVTLHTCIPGVRCMICHFVFPSDAAC